MKYRIMNLSPSLAASRTAFPAMNGMRGAAALAVAVFHAHPLFGMQVASL